VFGPENFAYFRYLAKEAAGNTAVSFDQRRLMIKTKFTTDEDYTGVFIIISFASILLLFMLGISIVVRSWSALFISVIGLVILFWLSKNRLKARNKNIRRQPNFVYDSDLKIFLILGESTAECPEPCYERYASNTLLATRVRILSSTQYFDDVIVELSFAKEAWVTALRLNSCAFANELEQAIKKCAALV
jgi:hypothetical protein